MDDKTREALEGSIRKWEAIVARTGTDEGGLNCPLCHEFVDRMEDQRYYNDEGEYVECSLCPVFLRTGESHCGNTPYFEWCAATKWDGHQRHNDSPAALKAAQAELDFLKSLRESNNE